MKNSSSQNRNNFFQQNRKTLNPNQNNQTTQNRSNFLQQNQNRRTLNQTED